MPIPSTSDANGIWKLNEVRNAVYNSAWPVSPSVPGAPTLTGLTPNTGQISAAFTAPGSDGGRAVTSYTATASPGGATGTGASSPVTITGLTDGTTYSVTVVATNAVGSSVASNSLSATAGPIANGQQAYTTAGTYSWVAPAGVTTVSAVAVGSGAGYMSNQYDGCGAPGYNSGGGGGGLGWKNNISVVPGSSYTVVVGAAGVPASGDGTATRANGNQSYFVSTSTVRGLGGSPYGAVGFTGDGGGNGGSPSYSPESNGGGGAGGYSGSGGNGGVVGSTTGKAGAGGGGSGGGQNRGSGGGVGILGEGSSGASVSSGQNGNPGSGGSGVTYGGGGGNGGMGGGAVRIIWGNTGGARAFPSTRTGDL